MTVKTARIPGPDHPITIEPNPDRVIIRSGGSVIADTRNGLSLREASYPAVQYIPRVDVHMEFLVRSDHSTYCPYKGQASYFSVIPGGERAIDAVWTYEDPYPAVTPIKDHFAFYTDRIDSIEII